MLTQEQIKEIKKQLIFQVESSFPDDKKESAKKQIESMDSEQLEAFLKQNNLIKSGEISQQGIQKCIFCSIISGDAKSYKIDENESAVAVLEINPISKGHVLIIFRNHLNDEKIASEKALNSLAENVSKKIKKEFKPKKIDFSQSELFGHKIINVLPVYENENFSSERRKASEDELDELHKILGKKHKLKTIKKPKSTKVGKKESQKLWLPKRIP